MKKTLFIIHYSLFIIFTPIMLSFLGCTNPTSSATGSLSGTVHLENQQVDHSGIVIGIYELAELDPDIVDANTKWPHIGVKINQMTEFDHRFGNLIKYTETDENGNFKITDIPTGRYNLVAMKEGFGFRYVYNVTINEGDNALSEQCKMKNEKCKMKDRSKHYSFDSKTNPDRTADIILYPETYINSDITEETVFESSRHYIIEDDIYVFGDLTIEHGAVVRLNPGVKLTIFGDLTAVGEEDNMIWFTSNHGFDNSEFSILNSQLNSKFKIQNSKLRAINPYNRIELSGTTEKSISYCKFDNAGTGLLSRVNGFSISHCIFRDSDCGFYATTSDSTFCSNLLCENITNEDGGIYFNTILDGFIKNNIIINSQTGIKLKYHCSDEIIYNNYITDCYNGMIITFYSNPTIRNNNIYNCEKNILTAAQSEPYIHHNIINGNWNFHLYYEPGSNVFDACPIIKNNNLKATEYFFYISKYNSKDIVTYRNYFSVSEEEIESMIYDKDDYPEEYQDLVGNVICSPKNTQNTNCGIQ